MHPRHDYCKKHFAREGGGAFWPLSSPSNRMSKTKHELALHACHRVFRGAAQRGAQFYFIFSGSPGPFSMQQSEPFLPQNLHSREGNPLKHRLSIYFFTLWGKPSRISAESILLSRWTPQLVWIITLDASGSRKIPKARYLPTVWRIMNWVLSAQKLSASAQELRWAKSRDSYRRIASESYHCNSNH